jgi:hypothetical protein
MRRKWRAEWVEDRMHHSIEFSTIGGAVRDAENWLKVFMQDVGGTLPEVYHLRGLAELPESTKFHSVLDWPEGREGILWICPIVS